MQLDSYHSLQDGYITPNWTQENSSLPNYIHREMVEVDLYNTPIQAEQKNISREANSSVPISYNAAPKYLTLTHGITSSSSPPHTAHPQINNKFPLAGGMSLQYLPTPSMIRPPQRPHAYPLATQENKSRNKTNTGIKKKKRFRTAFTTEQVKPEQEMEYTRTRFVNRTRRLELCSILSLKETPVKVWFQNRRMKEKKQEDELSEKTEDGITMQSVPEVPMFYEQQQANNNRTTVFSQEYPAPCTFVPSTAMGLPWMSLANYT